MRRFDISLKSSILVTTAMPKILRISHREIKSSHAGERRAEESHPGDRAHDAPPGGALAAPGAARPEVDFAVHAAASLDGAPHPVGALGRPACRPRRAGQLSP